MLNERREYLRAKTGKTNAELDKYPIITNGDEQGSVMEYCKISTASAVCKKLIEIADIPELLLTLPDLENDLVTDINKYYGDIFFMNFKYRANHLSGMTRGEINYILGVSPPDTFSQHYCDYSNDFVQFGMVKKLERWTSLYSLPASKSTNAQMINKLYRNGEVISCNSDGKCVADLDIIIDTDPSVLGDTLILDIDCDNGFDAELIYFQDSERKE